MSIPGFERAGSQVLGVGVLGPLADTTPDPKPTLAGVADDEVIEHLGRTDPTLCGGLGATP